MNADNDRGLIHRCCRHHRECIRRVSLYRCGSASRGLSTNTRVGDTPIRAGTVQTHRIGLETGSLAKTSEAQFMETQDIVQTCNNLLCLWCLRKTSLFLVLLLISCIFLIGLANVINYDIFTGAVCKNWYCYLCGYINQNYCALYHVIIHAARNP